MMKFFKFLFSGTFMGMLLVTFAVAMGYATFIENDFDSTTAKMMVYNAKWFELVMVLMVINFSGMIYTKRLYRKSKINVLLIHISLIIIIIGAAITRYIGYEGMMHIRDGQTSNLFVSSDHFINILVESGAEQEHLFKRVWLTPLNKTVYEKEVELNGKEVEIHAGRYFQNAQQVLVPDPSGSATLSMVVGDRSGRKNVFLRENEPLPLGDFVLSLGDTTNPNHVQFLMLDTALMVRTPLPALGSNNPNEVQRELAGKFQPLDLMSLYTLGEMTIMVKEMNESALIQYMPMPAETNGTSVVEMNISVDGETRNFFIRGGVGRVGELEKFTLNGVNFSMNVGAQQWALPFFIRLDAFELERYPGSNSPSSFASRITLIDKEKGIEKPYRVFMNNVLDYGGFRFYQSSYDSDEQGTIFSVNHDKLGTVVTYIGYGILFATLLASLFTRRNRFAKLKKKLNEVHLERKKLALTIAALFLGFLVSSSQTVAQVSGAFRPASKAHAAKFGSLLIQNKDGRIVPVNTLTEQIVVKVYKKSKYNGLNSDQVILGMFTDPLHWQEEPLIMVRDEQIQEELGVESEFAALSRFFDSQNGYLFREKVNEVYNKKPATRDTYDKELIYVDERVNVLLMGFNGSFLRLFPLPEHPSDKWGTQQEYSVYMRRLGTENPDDLFSDYIQALKTATQTGDYTRADAVLDQISEFQIQYGQALIPPAFQTRMEVLYNKINVFKRLFPVYMLLGFALLGIFLINLFKPSLEFRRLVQVLYILLLIAFIVQTLGLALRWYISGHEPWSNGYESMIYIAWAVMLAGFIFHRQSAITLSVTSILAGITLLTAHMSWMNPEITNLVPVLKSYWLTIHVATITASYGFLGLASMMGFLNLSIMIFRNKKNLLRVNLTIKELTYIIEMSMMVGLILLVIGNFLGGVWANESWGRYWGWDPKETWSLVTIIVYSFILHMSLIPSFKNLYSMNFAAMIAFASVLMTYFGVNYYLSGLHSYAAGDPVPVPSFVYYVLLVVAVVSILALINVNRMRKQAEGYDEAYAEEEVD